MKVVKRDLSDLCVNGGQRGHLRAVKSQNYWGKALHGYETALLAAGRSPGTVRLHRHYLAGLRAAHPATPWAITTPQLREALSNPRWSAETRKSARQAFRGFYRWAHGDGLIDHDPAFSLPGIRVPNGVPRPAPALVVAALLAQNPCERVWLMAALAALVGLRAAEIARVHRDDYVGDELLITGKGGKVRAVPILEPRLAARLEAVDGWAFPNGLGSHLTPGHVSKLLSAAMPPGWTAHTLRHRCATVAYAGTRDLLAVGQLLGHSRPETTQRYVRIPDDAVRAAVTAASAVA
jgi:integrase